MITKNATISFAVYSLSEEFYAGNWKEALTKDKRPYLILGVQKDYALLLVAIPFRSNISHEHCFTTDKKGVGIDYSKAIIINLNEISNNFTKKQIREVFDKHSLIGTSNWISDTEFESIKGKEHVIFKGYMKYVKSYFTESTYLKEVEAKGINSKKKRLERASRFTNMSTLKNYELSFIERLLKTST